jgi:hypothetical protein
VEKEFNCIRSSRIFVVADFSIVWLLELRAPLLPQSTLRIFSNYKPGREEMNSRKHQKWERKKLREKKIHLRIEIERSESFFR